jgi:competence protein ComFC
MEELSELSMLENFTKPILIPIPLAKKRLRLRGYNQSELICQELIKVNNTRLSTSIDNGIDLTLEKNILIKPKDTEHQARIRDRNLRLKNLSGSFTIKNIDKNKVLLKNRNIILVDDITTTGATLGEARKTLKQCGARKIIAFTIAH